jgi:ABC-type dipeptide/oligopeptide/nickel transport system permease component
MGLGRIGGYIFVALVAALLTFYAVRITNGDSARCEVRVTLTPKTLAAIKNNLERARGAAHEATMNDKHDQQAAYQAEEVSAEQEFIYDLRDPVGAEYTRHRRALDGCF